MAGSAWRPRPISAHPSHGSWPHRELHRRPQWQGPHAVPPSFRRTPHTVRGPIGSSTEGPSGRVRMQFQPHFCASLTRFVAPLGAPPKAPVAASACFPTTHSANPSHASWPHRAPHRRRYSQPRYPQLSRVGSFARLMCCGRCACDCAAQPRRPSPLFRRGASRRPRVALVAPSGRLFGSLMGSL